MTFKNKYLILLFSAALIGFTACNDKWEEHNELSEAVLSENLMQQIQANPNLSKFNEYLVQTGYAELLQSSKTYTVWAPNNQALAALDQNIISDPEKLKNFVGNHISNQRFFTSSSSQRVKMLNGKYLILSSNQLEGANIETATANRYSGNGVVHVLTEAVAPRQNIWEFMLGSNQGMEQSTYIQSLNYNSFDPSKAEVERIDETTGRPIYKAGTGIVARNRFTDRVLDVKREDSLFTFIVLTDNAFASELNELKPFFNTSTSDSTTQLASYHLVKDLAFRGLILPENLPDTLVSTSNVKVPIDKNAIVQTYRASNGIVYVMNKVDFALKNKIQPIVIEGENASGFSRNDQDIRIHRRYREWASNMLDIRVRDHGIANFHIQYRVNNTYSTKYKFYWRAVNDFSTTAFSQKLALEAPTSVNFPYKPVTPNNFEEVYLGEYTADRFGTLNLFLVGANSTNNTLNPLVLDYIKMVPVL